MKALFLIINRELSSRVRTKAFVLTTLLTPLLMALVMLLPAYLMSIEDTNIKTVYVIDDTQRYVGLFETSDNYKFIDITGNPTEEKMDALLQINKDLAEHPLAVTFFSEQQQPPRELLRYINSTLSEAVRADRVTRISDESKLEPEVATTLQKVLKEKSPIRVNTMCWSEDGATKDTLGEEVSFIGIILTFFMMMFIMVYGSMVIQSVIEEKSNRIVEVILSSVKPFDLMMGKIIGVGLTGLLQMFIWFAVVWLGILGFSLFSGFSTVGLDSADMDALNNFMSVSWVQVSVCFVLYFIGGYLLFASLYAMFGSAANDAQEAQQLTSPLMILLMVAFYTGYVGARNPEGSIALWCSFIPFTSPIAMLVRAPFEVPIWQIIVSLLILYVTAFLCAQLAGRVYKTGILMTGKKVSFKDLFKWITYK